MLEASLRYQMQGDEWLKRVLIGGGLTFVGLLFGIFILPLALFFTVNGYMLEVMRRVLRGETTNPPEWGELDLVDITVDGLKHLVVVLPYGLAAVVIAGIPAGLLLVIGAIAEISALTFLGVAVGGLLYLVAVLALAFVTPVVTANFVRKDSIAAGFDLDVLRTITPNRTMLKAVLVAFLVNIISSAIANILGFTIVGLLAVPFVQFVFQSAVFYVWADGFADAYEAEYGEPPITPVADTDVDADPSGPTEEAI
jgi:hypothetical protein